MSRHAHLFAALRDTVLQQKGALDPAVRRDAHAGVPLDAPLEAWVSRVRGSAASIGDDDVAALRAHSLSDDEIYELTVCTAVGAAEMRLRAALAALGRK